jgi:hypothetical protein
MVINYAFTEQVGSGSNIPDLHSGGGILILTRTLNILIKFFMVILSFSKSV